MLVHNQGRIQEFLAGGGGAHGGKENIYIYIF